MNLRTPRMLLFAVLAVVIFATGAVACSDDDDNGGDPTPSGATSTAEAPSGEIPSVAIVANDYLFVDAPESIAGGLTRIDFKNESVAEDHQAQLLRLNEDVSYSDFDALFDNPETTEAEIFALVATAAGGPGTSPGGDNDNVIDLEEGTYALICFIPSPTDGIPHAFKGMRQELQVTAAPDEQPEAPEVDVTVSLADFEFDAPETLAAGETTFEVTNNGTQAHEMAVFSLDEGITTEDVVAILTEEVELQGPPPFAFTGQVAVMTPGESGITTLDLEAGTFALLCFVTDPETETPHFALGMAQDLVVE